METIFVIGGLMLALMGIGIGFTVKEFREMEDERTIDYDADFIDYDGIGNQGRFVKDKSKKGKKSNSKVNKVKLV